MTQDCAEEFMAVREAVQANLRSQHDLRKIRGDWLGQLLVLPAFHKRFSLDLFRRSREETEEYFAVRTTWRSDLDAEAFRTPVERLRFPRPYVPTIEVQEVAVAFMVLDRILRDLRTIPIPLALPTQGIGLDGVSFELAFGDDFYGCRLHWWWRLPKAWQPLKLVVDQLYDLGAPDE